MEGLITHDKLNYIFEEASPSTNGWEMHKVIDTVMLLRLNTVLISVYHGL